MIVCKFGGSSLSSSEKIISVSEILINKLKKNKVTCIFSAMGKTTNNILKCSESVLNNNMEEYTKIFENIKIYSLNIMKALLTTKESNYILKKIETIFIEIDTICKGLYYLKDLSDKTKDKLISYGEILSTTIIFQYLTTKFPEIKMQLLDTRKCIKTDSNFGNAYPDFSKTEDIIQHFYKKNPYTNLFIVPGFISSDMDNNITTLGRGGGDYTAAIFGHCLNSKIVEIWTDVNGIMSADPRKVKTAINIPKISYQEMLDLSHYGANIIYTPTIMPLYKKKIPILIKNTNFPDYPGTEIHYNLENRDSIATAISTIESISLLKISGEYLIGNIGFSGKLFSQLSNININITMISQSSSEHSIYLVIYKKDLKRALKMLNNYYEKNIKNNTLEIISYADKSVISIVTYSQKNILKISSIIFPLLKNINVNIYTQTASDNNICLIIDRDNVNRVLNIIHNNLFLNKNKNIFIIGTGLVGSELIKQLRLIDTCNILLIANSKKYILNIKGISDDFTEKLNNGLENNTEHIINTIINLNLPNSIFIDCTSSKEIYPYYLKLLQNNVSIVTPNKKANTTNYTIYNELTKFNNYKFETTVGAGLPIVHTIQNIKKCQDKVLKIEAILSGSLSYIFNTFMDTNKLFSQIVKEAQELGYTEPNPKNDLEGSDVVRKMLIITRLLGFKFEMDDIVNNQFLSDECLESDEKNDFFKKLELLNDSMDKKKKIANENKLKLKHVAIFEDNIVKVQLINIDDKHSFYNLSGSDNMIIITTEYYNKNPLIIRGPGAGAEVTASGIVSDIFNIV
jgi:bifunctional aspartokinase / homoserine dehydrogenase 1